MATHFTTWREIHGILEAEYQALLSQAGNLRPVLGSFSHRADNKPWRELESVARLQGRGGVVDEACSVFALTRRWPAMSRSLSPLVLLRLSAARDLAAYISLPERPEPKDVADIDCELALRWALVDYWHMGGVWRSRYAKETFNEDNNSALEKQDAFHRRVPSNEIEA